MTGNLLHRGPDGSGSWVNDSVVFAHRRLSVLDVSDAGAQPMVSSSGRYVTTFNGEIYNFRELRNQLRLSGWRNRSESDTEVLLQGIEQWGLDGFLDRVDGMFAFALLDAQRQRLSLVRDPFGEKPLVYRHEGDRIVFASEVRSLASVPHLNLRIAPESLNDFFRFGYVPGAATIFEGVTRVAPASVVEFDLTDVRPPRIYRYWSPPSWDLRRSSNIVDVEALEQLLRTSVRSRLLSDRPIGALLSGGIDSSLTCALAAAEMSQPIKTYTMGWDSAEYDESQQAARVAQAIGSDHHHVTLSRRDVVDTVRSMGSVMDEPFADPSLLATRLVASAARESLVVALSGDGGDELFAGYNRHRWLLKVHSLQSKVPQGIRRRIGSSLIATAPVLDQATRILRVTRRPRLIADKTRKLARAFGATSISAAYQQVIALEPRIGRERHLSPEIISGMDSDNVDQILWALRRADLKGYLPDDVLAKVDRASMSVSLETRTPFLNRDVAEFAMRLGKDSLIGPDGGKAPLRQVLKRVLPGVDFGQPKTGFGIPVGDFLAHEMSGDLADAVSSFSKRDFDLPICFKSELEKFNKGDQSRIDNMWTLLMFEYWMENSSGLS